MKIAYDAKRAFCNGTGLGNYSRGVIGAAVVSGVSAVLYTPRVDTRFEHAFDSLDDVKIRRPQGLWRLTPAMWRTLGYAQRVQADGVQLYHGLSHELPLALPAEVRRVVTMHDLIVRRYPDYFNWADRLIHRLKQQHACRTADIVVAISEQTKRDLMEMMHIPEEKIRVVYQSCDPIFWDWCRNETHPSPTLPSPLPTRYILCVGTLEERKNQLAVIAAMERLPKEVGLVLVGRPRGAYGRKVASCAGGRVQLLSGVDFRDFPALYAGAVASVYMSRFEGFGIPILESLCCDTPVVTSNISSMPEAGGDAALYADPDDVETIAAHLLRLLEDETFRQERIAKGRIQRMKFAPEKVSQEMMAVYRSLLDD